MIATLNIQGFGFTPDEAIEDLERRCQTQTQTGWLYPTATRVEQGVNPYSMSPVYGYVATTTLTKETA